VVDGRIEGNGDSNTVVQGNVVYAGGSGNKPVLQFGYADGLVVKDNIVVSTAPDQTGIYVWGSSRYNPEPSKAVLIADNILRVRGQPISLNGVRGGLVRDNLIEGSEKEKTVDTKRTEEVEIQ
jgi:hypothetical protein